MQRTAYGALYCYYAGWCGEVGDEGESLDGAIHCVTGHCGLKQRMDGLGGLGGIPPAEDGLSMLLVC